MWDWSEIENPSARFENLIASHLLKLSGFLHDYEGYKARLCFLRNVDKKEVDFLVTIDEKPWFAVEVEQQDETLSKNMLYFKERLDIPLAFQVLEKSGVDRLKNGVRIISADKFLTGLI